MGCLLQAFIHRYSASVRKVAGYDAAQEQYSFARIAFILSEQSNVPVEGQHEERSGKAVVSL